MEAIETVTTKTESITEAVLRILREMTSDWDLEFTGPISPDTRLVADLGFASIDIVQLAIALEEHFGIRGLPFQQLTIKSDGQYVDDIQVSELMAFLAMHLAGTDARAPEGSEPEP
jgi:acyl carrier protein